MISGSGSACTAKTPAARRSVIVAPRGTPFAYAIAARSVQRSVAGPRCGNWDDDDDDDASLARRRGSLRTVHASAGAAPTAPTSATSTVMALSSSGESSSEARRASASSGGAMAHFFHRLPAVNTTRRGGVGNISAFCRRDMR